MIVLVSVGVLALVVLIIGAFFFLAFGSGIRGEPSAPGIFPRFPTAITAAPQGTEVQVEAHNAGGCQHLDLGRLRLKMPDKKGSGAVGFAITFVGEDKEPLPMSISAAGLSLAQAPGGGLAGELQGVEFTIQRGSLTLAGRRFPILEGPPTLVVLNEDGSIHKVQEASAENTPGFAEAEAR